MYAVWLEFYDILFRFLYSFRYTLKAKTYEPKEKIDDFFYK